MANVRTVLNLTPDAIAVIERNAPSANKKGQWSSEAIVTFDRLNRGVGDIDGGDGLLERIDGRLARIEKQMLLLFDKLGD